MPVVRISTHSEVLDLLGEDYVNGSNTNINHKRSPWKKKQRRLNIESWVGKKTRAMVVREVVYRKGQYPWNTIEQTQTRPLMTERGPGYFLFEAFSIC